MTDSVKLAPPTDPRRPPRRTRITAALAALACAACCALPLLITAGVLTGAGAATARAGLLVTSATLLATAAGLWWLHHRRAIRTSPGCGDPGCNC
jgi:hypothetical protein